MKHIVVQCNQPTTAIISTNIEIKSVNMSFTADTFQQDAIDALAIGHNVLVCAPTCSGKTYIAEKTIERLLQETPDSIIIYTTPIKVLSNEKCGSFAKKFGYCGLVTGDMKHNVDSRVLVMTTEIYNQVLDHRPIMDDDLTVMRTIDPSRIALVVFDEAHYIADPQRGQAWEESIIKTHNNTQMLLLSATISQPSELRDWIGKIHDNRESTLVEKHERPIPLTHYFFHVTKNKYEEMRQMDGTLPYLYGNKKMMTVMKSDQSPNITEIRKLFASEARLSYRDMLDGQGLINYTLDHLIAKDMIPAIFFVFSCTKCEDYAMKARSVLSTSKQATESCNRLEHLIKDKKNAKEIMNSVAYVNLMKCVERGVAWHHAGLLPILKDAIEFMFGEGHIKVLFATETFSVGVNYPARSVVFTSASKMTSDGYQPLPSFSYHQMAGRAGRRGHDVLGNVIHLPSIYRFERHSSIEDKVQTMYYMMQPPQTHIQRSLTLSSSLVLEGCKIGDPLDYIKKIIKKGYMYRDIDFKLVHKTEHDQYKEYLQMKDALPCHRRCDEAKRQHDISLMESNHEFMSGLWYYTNVIQRAINLRTHVKMHYNKLLSHLIKQGCLNINDEYYQLTNKGHAMLEFGERVNVFPLLEWIERDLLIDLSLADVASFTSLMIETEVRRKNRDDDTPLMAEEDLDDRQLMSEVYYRVSMEQQVDGVYEFNTSLQHGMFYIVREWLSGGVGDDDRSICDIAEKYDVQPGNLYKSLLRLKNVYLECSCAATHMDCHIVAKKYKDVSDMMCSRGLIQDTLYLM